MFDALFERFWKLSRHEDEQPPRPEPPRLDGGETRLGAAELVDSAYARGEGMSPPRTDTPPQTYSSQDALMQKDFAMYRDDELRAARRYLRRLAPKLASATTRRRRPARSSREVDLRRSLRLAARQGGEVLRLAHRRLKVRKLNVLLLCDVSGSMDVYSRFFVQFLYGLQHELRDVSTFMFSTRLFEVTPMLRTRSFDDALSKVSKQVQGWSGGTRIGACLAELNRRHARQRIGPRTVVVVISDGWDRGDVAELGREMRALKRRCYRVIWLNPLLGASGYRPLAQGMAAALLSRDLAQPAARRVRLSSAGAGHGGGAAVDR